MSSKEDNEQFWKRITTFVADVEDVLANRPQERAALRRSLGGDPFRIDEVRPVARRVVIPHLRSDDGRVRERAFYTVAALIASQPQKDTSRENEDAAATETASEQQESSARRRRTENLGTELARAAVDRARAANSLRLDSDQKAQRFPEEDRLHLLCRQDNDGLHRFIPKVLRFLRSRDITPDWVGLTYDLAYWSGQGRDRVAKNWLDGFYQKLDKEKRKEREERNTKAPETSA